jgi:hypothetical protein
MNRTKIAFLVAAVVALTLTAQEANSASFNSISHTQAKHLRDLRGSRGQ